MCSHQQVGFLNHQVGCALCVGCQSRAPQKAQHSYSPALLNISSSPLAGDNPTASKHIPVHIKGGWGTLPLLEQLLRQSPWGLPYNPRSLLALGVSRKRLYKGNKPSPGIILAAQEAKTGELELEGWPALQSEF